MSIKVSVDGFPADLERAVLDHITESLNDAGERLQDAMRNRAPKDLGDHSQGYRFEPFQRRGDELEGAFVNNVENSLFRERGRPPGRQPPIAAIAPWAIRKGLNPYLVARKIGKVGTDRWIDNDNPLGIDRASTPGDIQVNADSIVRTTLDEGIAAANEFEF